MKKSALFFFACLSLTACSHVAPLKMDSKAKPLTPITTTAYDAQVLWQAQSGQGTKGYHLQLDPVRAGTGLFIADAAGRLTCYDFDSGKLQWQQQTHLAFSTGLGTDGYTLYVGTEDGKLVAFDALTGDVVWQLGLSNQILGKPTLYDGLVYVKTIDDHIYALDKRSGHIVWQHRAETKHFVLRQSGAVGVGQGIAVAGMASGKLKAFDAKDGHVLWEQTVASPKGLLPVDRLVDVTTQPIVAKGLVFAATYQGRIGAFDLHRGQPVWHHAMSTHTAMALDANRLYVTDNAGQVWAFDRSTGAVVWRNQDLSRRGLSAPVVMGQWVMVGDAAGVIHGLDAHSGQLLARQTVKKFPILATPVVWQHRLAAVDSRGYVSTMEWHRNNKS